MNTHRHFLDSSFVRLALGSSISSLCIASVRSGVSSICRSNIRLHLLTETCDMQTQFFCMQTCLLGFISQVSSVQLLHVVVRFLQGLQNKSGTDQQ